MQRLSDKEYLARWTYKYGAPPAGTPRAVLERIEAGYLPRETRDAAAGTETPAKTPAGAEVDLSKLSPERCAYWMTQLAQVVLTAVDGMMTELEAGKAKGATSTPGARAVPGKGVETPPGQRFDKSGKSPSDQIPGAATGDRAPRFRLRLPWTFGDDPPRLRAEPGSVQEHLDRLRGILR